MAATKREGEQLRGMFTGCFGYNPNNHRLCVLISFKQAKLAQFLFLNTIFFIQQNKMGQLHVDIEYTVFLHARWGKMS